MRRLLAGAGLLAMLGTVTVLAGAGAATSCRRPEGNGWASSSLPDFPHRLDRPAPVYSAPSADTFAAAGGTVWVTDGNTVMTSHDGGCSWSSVYSLPTRSTQPDVNASSVINELAVVGAQPLALVEGSTQGSVPTLAVLRLGKRTATKATGLPPWGQPVYDKSGIHRRLFTRPGDPSTVYVIVCSPGTNTTCAEPRVFGSIDGGRSFTARGVLPHAGSTYAGVLAVDPTDSRHLWASDPIPNRLRASVDGGQTWTPVGPVLHGFHDLTAVLDGRRVRLLGRDSQGGAVRASDDGGRTWRAAFPPAPLESFEGTGTTVHALAVPEGDRPRVLSWATGGDHFREVGPPRRPELIEVKSTAKGVFAISEDRLWHRSVPPPARRRAAATDASTRGGTAASPVPRPALVPAAQRVEVPVGGSRLVRVALHLPRSPGLAQVGLLLDATGSMETAGQGLAASFGDVTMRLSPSARFAVATFGEYALRQYGVDAPEFNVPYERLTDLVPAGAALDRALRGIRNNGGSNDTLTSALPAVEQALTGRGQHLDDPGRLPNSDIPPGQQMSFHGGGLRVLFLATDSEAHQPPGYPGPSLTSVVAELRRRGVLLLGLDVAGGYVRGTRFLTALAAGSGARAPAEGIDCDGDGRVDLTSGQALVCPVGDVLTPKPMGQALAGAVTALLDALPQPQRVSLDADGERVEVQTPSPFVVDTHLRGAARPLDLVVRCPLAPTHEQITIQAMREGEVLTSALLDVTCAAGATGALGTPRSLGPAPPLRAPPAPAAVVPPPPPAVPGQAPLPQAGPAGAGQPAGATAPREAEQPMLATAAAADEERQAAIQLAMEAAAVAGFAAVVLRRRPELARGHIGRG